MAFAYYSYASRVGSVQLLVQFLDGLVLKGYPWHGMFSPRFGLVSNQGESIPLCFNVLGLFE